MPSSERARYFERAKNVMCHVGLALLNDVAMASDRTDARTMPATMQTLRNEAFRLLSKHADSCPVCLDAFARLGAQIAFGLNH